MVNRLVESVARSEPVSPSLKFPGGLPLFSAFVPIAGTVPSVTTSASCVTSSIPIGLASTEAGVSAGSRVEESVSHMDIVVRSSQSSPASVVSVEVQPSLEHPFVLDAHQTTSMPELLVSPAPVRVLTDMTSRQTTLRSAKKRSVRGRSPSLPSSDCEVTGRCSASRAPEEAGRRGTYRQC